MIRFFVLLLLFTISLAAHTQRLSFKTATEKIKQGLPVKAEDLGFKEYELVMKADTIRFYTWQRKDALPTSIYMTLPGTNAENIYTPHKDDDGSYWYNSLTSFDFSYLPDNYLFVIVAKPGFGFFGPSSSKNIPAIYWEKTSLMDRVIRADIALKHIQKYIIRKPESVAVFGYSEGFYVAAKLATINKSITHLGIGGGGGTTDFYDFILDNQKAVARGKLDIDTAVQANAKIIAAMHGIMDHADSTAFKYGYSYKRWASFAIPAIESLVKLKIPIYQVHGSDDESTPIESAYVVPIEFARLRKNNLTFTVYPRADHSLTERKNGKEIPHWDEMLNKFFNWVATHPY